MGLPLPLCLPYVGTLTTASSSDLSVYCHFSSKMKSIEISEGKEKLEDFPAPVPTRLFPLPSYLAPVHQPRAQIVRLPLSACSRLLAPSSNAPRRLLCMPSCHYLVFTQLPLNSQHTSWGYYPAGHTDLTWGHCNLMVLTSDTSSAPQKNTF